MKDCEDKEGRGVAFMRTRRQMGGGGSERKVSLSRGVFI